MNRDDVLYWLKEDDPNELNRLWSMADTVRRESVGDAIHLRGLVEISNHCARQCAYCGIRASNTNVTRYRMTEDEILECARLACQYGYGTLVMQAGEDPGFTAGQIESIILRVKNETSLAVTLSLGERTRKELTLWREAGADRYLLRFETSNPVLFEKIHPAHPVHTRQTSVLTDAEKPTVHQRLAKLEELHELDFEVGSGVLIGIPGQTFDDLTDDLMLFRKLNLHMIGVGPFLPHPDTPLGDPAMREAMSQQAGDEQVPGNQLMTLKVVALARLLCPDTNIPSTTALAIINKEGRQNGLQRGANIVMPNLTPPEYRKLYEIYPEKAHKIETAEETDRTIRQLIASIGRTLGSGRGDSPHKMVH